MRNHSEEKINIKDPHVLSIKSWTPSVNIYSFAYKHVGLGNRGTMETRRPSTIGIVQYNRPMSKGP